jgi:sugar/nucleoside kinase (ribokinase family)
MIVLCMGEMMVEVVARPDDAARIGFGGDTFHTAVYLARRGPGDLLSDRLWR